MSKTPTRMIGTRIASLVETGGGRFVVDGVRPERLGGYLTVPRAMLEVWGYGLTTRRTEGGGTEISVRSLVAASDTKRPHHQEQEADRGVRRVLPGG